MLSPQTQINQHRVKWITSLHERFVFIVYLYTFAFHYALGSMLRDYIDIRFNALENTHIVNQIWTIYLILYCSTHIQWRKCKFLRLSRQFIIGEFIICSHMSVYRYNTVKYGTCNLQNLSHGQANYNDGGEIVARGSGRFSYPWRLLRGESSCCQKLCNLQATLLAPLLYDIFCGFKA